jgi:HemY protein
MRLGVVMLIGLFIGAFSAHFLLEDRGYVLLRLQGYSVEMSVPVLIMALVALYLAVRAIVRVIEAPRAIGGALGARERAVAQGALTRGLSEISAGNLSRGERILTRQAIRGDAPVLAYLGAARAAQLQGATARRDDWLKRARAHAPGDVPAVLLTQAELEIADGQYDEALATLRRLEAMRPKHAQCLAMQAGIYEQRQDWQALEQLLPRLRREKAMSEQALDRLERRLNGEVLRIAADASDREGLRQRWRQLGSRGQRSQTLTRDYVQALIRSGDDLEAVAVLRKRMRQQWDPALLYLVDSLGDEARRKLQPQVTAWRRKRADDPALLYAAAVLGAGSDPDKALERLEQSLARQPRTEAYELYGRLLDQQGRQEEATRAFQAALSCSRNDDASAAPRLETPRAAADRDQAGVAPERTDSPEPAEAAADAPARTAARRAAKPKSPPRKRKPRPRASSPS